MVSLIIYNTSVNYNNHLVSHVRIYLNCFIKYASKIEVIVKVVNALIIFKGARTPDDEI